MAANEHGSVSVADAAQRVREQLLEALHADEIGHDVYDAGRQLVDGAEQRFDHSLMSRTEALEAIHRADIVLQEQLL